MDDAAGWWVALLVAAGCSACGSHVGVLIAAVVCLGWYGHVAGLPSSARLVVLL